MLSVLGSLQSALACECIAHSVQGFIHPGVTMLPANAKGVLFHAPSRLDLRPALFSVTSSSGPAPLKIRIDPVELPPGHPMRARLPADGRLVRVGIEGGFVSGASYTVRYHAPEAYFNAVHASVNFSVDRAPLDLSTAHFDVALDGPAKGTMLPIATVNGSCATSRPVLVQPFHVRVPDALQRYLPAFSLLGEAQDALPGAAFMPLQYRPSLCTQPLFDRSALEAQQDMLYRDCHASADRVHVRAWVGMLEVDERFVLAEPASADLASARPPSCSPLGLLREAIERGDDREAGHLSCEIERQENLRLGFLDLETAPVPDRAQWIGLAHQADAKLAACGLVAMQRMLLMAKRVDPELRDTYLMLAEEKLRGSDQAEIAATLDQLSLLRRLLGKRRQALEGSPGWSRDSLLPLMPALLHLAEGGGPNARSALILIGSLAPARAVLRHD